MSSRAPIHRLGLWAEAAFLGVTGLGCGKPTPPPGPVPPVVQVLPTSRRVVDTHLVVDVQVDGGPMFKRMRPKARGMASIIKRRMAHIRVALE